MREEIAVHRDEVRVLIVGECVIFRRGLYSILEERQPLRAVGETSSDADAVAQALSAQRPDVATLDGCTEFGQLLGLCALIRQHASNPGIAILLCPSHQLRPFQLSTLLKAGVKAIATIHGDEQVLQAVLAAAHDEQLLHSYLLYLPCSTGPIIRLLDSNIERTSLLLSEDTCHLLSLLTAGHTEAEIGKAMHLSVAGVRHRIEKICETIGVRNRMELASWAGAEGYYQRQSASTIAPWPKDA